MKKVIVNADIMAMYKTLNSMKSRADLIAGDVDVFWANTMNLKTHGPLTIAQMNLLLHLPSRETKCNKKCNKTKERTFCTCSKINSNTKKLFRQDSFFKF